MRKGWCQQHSGSTPPKAFCMPLTLQRSEEPLPPNMRAGVRLACACQHQREHQGGMEECVCTEFVLSMETSCYERLSL